MWLIEYILIMIAALGGIGILFLIVGYILNNVVVYPKVLTHDRCKELEVEHENIQETDIEHFENIIMKQELSIKSEYGYNLHGYYIPNNNSKKIIIIVHGITASLYCSLKYVNMFLDNGLGVIIYDHRNHGLSGGTSTSFGYYEKYDLKSVTDWAFNYIGKDITIGIHGESMGAGTAMQYAALDNRIAFCIEDCGYSDLNELFRYRLKADYGLKSKLLVKIANFLTKRLHGWNYTDASPIKYIESMTTPMLFIHGELDKYVPTKMCKDLFDAKPGVKKMYIAKDAKHAESYSKNKKEYQEVIEAFLKAINII